MASELAELVKNAGTNDTISIVSSLDSGILGTVNDLLTRGRGLRNGSTMAGTASEAAAKAKQLEDRAQALLDDPGSYVISKLWLVPTYETTTTWSPVNLLFARWNTYTDERGEFVAAEIKFDDRLAREVHDAVQRAH